MMGRRKPPDEPETLVEADLYAAEGEDYREAWQLMSKGVKPPHYPPSLEGFRHERKRRSKQRKGLSPMALASEIVERG